MVKREKGDDGGGSSKSVCDGTAGKEREKRREGHGKGRGEKKRRVSSQSVCVTKSK